MVNAVLTSVCAYSHYTHRLASWTIGRLVLGKVSKVELSCLVLLLMKLPATTERQRPATERAAPCHGAATLFIDRIYRVRNDAATTLKSKNLHSTYAAAHSSRLSIMLRTSILMLVLAVSLLSVWASVDPTSVIVSEGTGAVYFLVDYAGRVFIETNVDGILQLDPATLTINAALPRFSWRSFDTPYDYGFLVDPQNNIYSRDNNVFTVFNSSLNITGTIVLPFDTVDHTEIDASGNFIFISTSSNDNTSYLIKCNVNGTLLAQYTFNSSVAYVDPHTLDANGFVYITAYTTDPTTSLFIANIYRLTNNLTQPTLLTVINPGSSYAEILDEFSFYLTVDTNNSILYVAFSSDDLTQGYLRAYNSTTGAFLSTISSKANIYQVRVDPTSGNVLASYGSGGSSIVKYNRSGSVLLTSTLYIGYSSLAVDSNNVLYAVDTENGVVVKLAANTYTVTQTYTPPAAIFYLASFYIGPNNNLYLMDEYGQIIYQVANSNGASVANYTICSTCEFVLGAVGPFVDSRGNVYAQYEDAESGSITTQQWYNNGTVAQVITAIDFSTTEAIAFDNLDRMYLANSPLNSTDDNYDQFFLQVVNITTLQTIAYSQVSLPANAYIGAMVVSQGIIYVGVIYINNIVNVITLSPQTFAVTQTFNIPTNQAEWSFSGLAVDTTGKLYVSYGTSVYLYASANTYTSTGMFPAIASSSGAVTTSSGASSSRGGSSNTTSTGVNHSNKNQAPIALAVALCTATLILVLTFMY